MRLGKHKEVVELESNDVITFPNLPRSSTKAAPNFSFQVMSCASYCDFELLSTKYTQRWLPASMKVLASCYRYAIFHGGDEG